MLFTPLALRVVMLVASRRVDVSYSRCGDCDFSHRRWTWLGSVSGVLLVLMLAGLLRAVVVEDARRRLA